jgi:hypothetical protein
MNMLFLHLMDRTGSFNILFPRSFYLLIGFLLVKMLLFPIAYIFLSVLEDTFWDRGTRPLITLIRNFLTSFRDDKVLIEPLCKVKS